MIVYVVQHIHELGDGVEDVKFIGAYSSAKTAEEAIERVRKMPGFRDFPDGFSVDDYPIDCDHWTSGFVTV